MSDQKHGKFYIEAVQREYFDTAEEREHYIKDQAPISFDAKSALVGVGAFEDYDEESQVHITVTLKEVKE